MPHQTPDHPSEKDLNVKFQPLLLPVWKQWRYVRCLPFQIIVRVLIAIIAAVSLILPQHVSKDGFAAQRFAAGQFYSMDYFAVDSDAEIDLYTVFDIWAQYFFIFQKTFTPTTDDFIFDNRNATINIKHVYWNETGGEMKRTTYEHLVTSKTDPEFYGLLTDKSIPEIRLILENTIELHLFTNIATLQMDYWSGTSTQTWEANFKIFRTPAGKFTLRPIFTYRETKLNKNVWLLVFIAVIGIICSVISFVMSFLSIISSFQRYLTAKRLSKFTSPPTRWNRVPFKTKMRFFSKWEIFTLLSAVLNFISGIFFVFRYLVAKSQNLSVNLIQGLSGLTSWVCVTRYLLYMRRESQLFQAVLFSCPFMVSYLVALLPVLIGSTLFSVALFGSHDEHYASYNRAFDYNFAAINGDEVWALYVRLNSRNPFLAITFVVILVSAFLFFAINLIRSIVERGYTSANFALYGNEGLYVGNAEFEHMEQLQKKMERMGKRRKHAKRRKRKTQNQSTSSSSSRSSEGSHIDEDWSSDSDTSHLSTTSSLSFSSSSNAFNEHERMADMMGAFEKRQGIAEKQQKMAELFHEAMLKGNDKTNKKNRRTHYEQESRSKPAQPIAQPKPRHRLFANRRRGKKDTQTGTSDDNGMTEPLLPRSQPKVSMDQYKDEAREVDEAMGIPDHALKKQRQRKRATSRSPRGQNRAFLDEPHSHDDSDSSAVLYRWAARVGNEMAAKLADTRIAEDEVNWDESDEKRWRIEKGVKLGTAFKDADQWEKGDENGSSNDSVSSGRSEKVWERDLGEVMELTRRHTISMARPQKIAITEDQLDGDVEEEKKGFRARRKKSTDEPTAPYQRSSLNVNEGEFTISILEDGQKKTTSGLKETKKRPLILNSKQDSDKSFHPKSITSTPHSVVSSSDTSDSTTEVERRRHREEHHRMREERRQLHEKKRQERMAEHKRRQPTSDQTNDADVLSAIDKQLENEERADRNKATRLLPSFLFSEGKYAAVLNESTPSSLSSTEDDDSTNSKKHKTKEAFEKSFFKVFPLLDEQNPERRLSQADRMDKKKQEFSKVMDEWLAEDKKVKEDAEIASPVAIGDDLFSSTPELIDVSPTLHPASSFDPAMSPSMSPSMSPTRRSRQYKPVPWKVPTLVSVCDDANSAAMKLIGEMVADWQKRMIQIVVEKRKEEKTTRRKPLPHRTKSHEDKIDRLLSHQTLASPQTFHRFPSPLFLFHQCSTDIHSLICPRPDFHLYHLNNIIPISTFQPPHQNHTKSHPHPQFHNRFPKPQRTFPKLPTPPPKSELELSGPLLAQLAEEDRKVRAMLEQQRKSEEYISHLLASEGNLFDDRSAFAQTFSAPTQPQPLIAEPPIQIRAPQPKSQPKHTSFSDHSQRIRKTVQLPTPKSKYVSIKTPDSTIMYQDTYPQQSSAESVFSSVFGQPSHQRFGASHSEQAPVPPSRSTSSRSNLNPNAEPFYPRHYEQQNRQYEQQNRQYEQQNRQYEQQNRQFLHQIQHYDDDSEDDDDYRMFGYLDSSPFQRYPSARRTVGRRSVVHDDESDDDLPQQPFHATPRRVTFTSRGQQLTGRQTQFGAQPTPSQDSRMRETGGTGSGRWRDVNETGGFADSQVKSMRSGKVLPKHASPTSGEDSTVFGMCSICICAIEVGEMISLVTKCQHAFHTKCLSEWFKVKRCCPVCRGTLSLLDRDTSSPS
ncbi:hypothetical protein BLNAU_15311 [Blattamonas nauphoetae]|uniref:RING-type domain-containing protein n=1 Tax=Blattamonas nauphoetae TaxID=2049346 RepID=A0ABQ9XGH4_9EUKA|nr:hypothetical protein BLNAU_15311 [Blattamonas nauphoetae]